MVTPCLCPVASTVVTTAQPVAQRPAAGSCSRQLQRKIRTLARSCSLALLLKGRLDAAIEAFDDEIDVGRRCDIRRRQQNVITALAIDGAGARIAGEPSLEHGVLDLHVDGQTRIERCLRLPIRNKLERPEQSAPANVADARMIAKSRAKPLAELVSPGGNVLNEIALEDDALNRKRGRTGNRMRRVGMSMSMQAGTAPQRVDDASLY